MKNLKKLTILCLALIMLACCMVPTYSWYTHDDKANSETANGIQYEKSSLPVSGYVASTDLTMTTYQGTLSDKGEVEYSDTALTDSTFTADAFNTSTSLDGNYTTTCYKTVISNSSSTAVRVGLYFENLQLGSSGDSICVGASSPIWRRVSADSMITNAELTSASTGTMRIYFNPNSAWTEETFYVAAYSITPDSQKLYTMTQIGSTTVYYADIPTDTISCYVACENTLSSTRKYRRTTDLVIDSDAYKEAGGTVVNDSSTNTTDCSSLSSTNSVLVTLTKGGITADRYMKPETTTVNEVTTLPTVESPANIINYNSKLTIEEGSTQSLALKSGTDYVGKSVEYASDNESVAKVDKSTGEVEAVAEGSATITTTVTGETYGDTYSVTTKVNVLNANNTIPLVQDIYIAAGDEEEVCWYVDNGTTSEIKDITLVLTL